MADHERDSSTVHERVAFGTKPSKMARRSGAGSHRSNMVIEHVQEVLGASRVQKARNAVRPPVLRQQQKSGVVHERVAFGSKPSKIPRRSGVGSHRSMMRTEHTQEKADASTIQKPRSAVRPRRDPNPAAKED
jgi:ribosomal protein L19E